MTYCSIYLVGYDPTPPQSDNPGLANGATDIPRHLIPSTLDPDSTPAQGNSLAAGNSKRRKHPKSFDNPGYYASVQDIHSTADAQLHNEDTPLVRVHKNFNSSC